MSRGLRGSYQGAANLEASGAGRNRDDIDGLVITLPELATAGRLAAVVKRIPHRSPRHGQNQGTDTSAVFAA